MDRLNDEQKKLMLNHGPCDSDRLSRLITGSSTWPARHRRLSMHQRPCDVARSPDRDRQRPRRAPHAIEYDAPDDLPEHRADPDKFTQVLTNVLENAIRHGPTRSR